MSIFLVRHASAGDRSRWRLNDMERPLDERGREQASRIADLFADSAVRAVWSSPATRCVQTVEPVAEAHSLNIRIRDELCEGADSARLLELILEEAAAPDNLILSSHGDVIPSVLNRLLRAGLEVTGDRGCAKASVWELRVDNGLITEGIYTAKP
ncbi:MAG: phosphoglycerate mutase family protein [Acidimicrobiaceae bacterium]|nr:phosphoglycerate mutase family protein [Acidimicrobiaceae bacterium]